MDMELLKQGVVLLISGMGIVFSVAMRRRVY